MNKLKQLLNEKKYLIMGILNFTPDSFSDGGDFYDVEAAIEGVRKMVAKPNVAEYMIEAGVDVLNDVNGAKGSTMADVAAKYDIPIFIMHNGGVEEGHEIEQVVRELGESVDICLNAGVKKENIIVDPGMGFGKTAEANLEITRKLELLNSLGCEILYAVSRKRTTDYVLGGNSNPKDRDIVSATLSLEAVKRGARMVRVHNVKVMKEALITYEIING